MRSSQIALISSTKLMPRRPWLVFTVAFPPDNKIWLVTDSGVVTVEGSLVARVRYSVPVAFTTTKSTWGRSAGPMPPRIRNEGFSKNKIDPHENSL